MTGLKVKARVVSKNDLPFALSKGVDVPEGTIGIIEEINEGGPEGTWLHVLWQVGGARGETYHNVNPSDVQLLDENPLNDPRVVALLYGYGGPFGSTRVGLIAIKTVVKT